MFLTIFVDDVLIVCPPLISGDYVIGVEPIPRCHEKLILSLRSGICIELDVVKRDYCVLAGIGDSARLKRSELEAADDIRSSFTPAPASVLMFLANSRVLNVLKAIAIYRQAHEIHFYFTFCRFLSRCLKMRQLASCCAVYYQTLKCDRQFLSKVLQVLICF
jgi:hypothetical protein